MTYETIDWDAEAQRISRAFGVIGSCDFVDDSKDGTYKALRRPVPRLQWLWYRLFNRYQLGLLYEIPTEEGLKLEYLYFYETGENWITLHDGKHLKERKITGLRVAKDGSYAVSLFNRHHWDYQMAKGLFFLDLLTPQVEAAIKATISAHEKMEWAAEYQARMETTE